VETLTIALAARLTDHLKPAAATIYLGL